MSLLCASRHQWPPFRQSQSSCPCRHPVSVCLRTLCRFQKHGWAWFFAWEDQLVCAITDRNVGVLPRLQVRLSAGAVPSREAGSRSGMVRNVQRGGSCELKSIQNRWGLGCSGKRWTSGLHSAYVATAAGSCAAVAWNLLCPPNTGCYWDSKPPALNQIGISCPISLCVCHAPVGQAFLQQGSASVCCMLISLTSLQGAQPGQPAEVQISRSPVWARF